MFAGGKGVDVTGANGKCGVDVGLHVDGVLGAGALEFDEDHRGRQVREKLVRQMTLRSSVSPVGASFMACLSSWRVQV
jgi:hypothetical protein